MNGTLYVQKKNEDSTLTAGWIHERPDGNTWITKPNGPGKDVLTPDTECALIFDLNNYCDGLHRRRIYRANRQQPRLSSGREKKAEQHHGRIGG